MHTLAFETSCDDTSVAILHDNHILTLRTASQTLTHAVTGGVVPEVAARLHENAILGLVDTVFADTGLTLHDMDRIACTESPWLLPSLLVGLSVSHTLATLADIPWIGVDHIAGHRFANFLERDIDSVPFPNICLSASGGHNEIYLWKSLFDGEILGETIDDAAGEAFDKVARTLGLGYPGGPIIDRLAGEYRGIYRGIFPVVLLTPDSLDVSFSGLKSAVRREIERRGSLTIDDTREIAFEFREAIVRALVTKIFLAVDRYAVRAILLTGGVSANVLLRERCQIESDARGITLLYPTRIAYCQDNAAMIGMWSYLRYTHDR